MGFGDPWPLFDVVVSRLIQEVLLRLLRHSFRLDLLHALVVHTILLLSIDSQDVGRLATPLISLLEKRLLCLLLNLAIAVPPRRSTLL